MKIDLLQMARERAGGGSPETGLALLLAASAAEIHAEASPAQAHGFFVAAGQRMAQGLDLGTVRDLDVLAQQINAFWARCGWGRVSLEPGDTGITVIHRGVPLTLAGDGAGLWPRLIVAVLEGAYDAWFRQLGSGPGLVTRLVREDADAIEFHHGR